MRAEDVEDDGIHFEGKMKTLREPLAGQSVASEKLGINDPEKSVIHWI